MEYKMKSNKKFTQLILAIFSITIIALYAYAAETPPIGQTTIPTGQTSIPTGQSEGVTADILGQRGGMFHPFLVLEEVYTDNLFATNSNTKSSFVTTIAPGIWIASPGTRQRLLSIDTTTTSPGGLHLSRLKSDVGRRYQSYFLYSPEYVMYSDYSRHAHLNHRAEGLAQLNLNSGLSFDLITLIHDREEIAGNGVTDQLYRYRDSLIDFIATYDRPSNLLEVQFAYSMYALDYDEVIVSYRDRRDHSFGLSATYPFWPKTSLFAEFNYSDIDYVSGSINDNIERRYYIGAKYHATAKTTGLLKLGYIEKDFESITLSDQDGFSIELQTIHHLTSKRTLQVLGYRKFQESDLIGASSYLSTGIDFGLSHQFTEKWSGTFNAFYEMNDYNEVNRDDKVYGFGPAVRFEPREWMFFDFGYYYSRNDSNVTFYDYDINQIFLRATLSL